MTNAITIGWVLINISMASPVLNQYVIEPIDDAIYADQAECMSALKASQAAYPGLNLECAEVKREGSEHGKTAP